MAALKNEAPGAVAGTGDEAVNMRVHTINADSVFPRDAGTDPSSLLSAAQGYVARGLTPIRLSPRSKVPPGKHDANSITTENATRLLDVGGYNLGLRLGTDHGGLVDFDLDWPEARRLGGLLLESFARFGRGGARGSHYLLRGNGPVSSKKYDLPELKGMDGLPNEHATCVLEVRATGYTMAPPSVHPNGEAVVWERDAALLEDSASGIHRRAGLLAFLSVVARFYPAQGSRDDFCMALAGALLAAGLAPGEADRCIVAVAEAAGDEEAGKRQKASQTSVKIEADESVTGIPRVVEMLGLPEGVAKRFRLWLGISERRSDGRPKVVYFENRLEETLDAAEDALLAAGVPIYQMGDRLVQPIRLDASEDSGGVARRAGALAIRELRPHRLRELMTSAANFVVIAVDAKGEEKSKPVAPSITSAMTYAARAGHWRLPVLRGVVECPTLRPDGTILSEEGYDQTSGLILDKGGATFAPVPDTPSRDDAVAALDQLRQLLGGFPFVDGGSQSVALSAILTAVCRKALRTAPLHGFSAPTMGTGKSLLADVVAMIATGRDAPVMSQGKDDEDDRKRLLSVLMQGDPVVVIDNVTRPVTGDALCSILTSEVWQERKLGVNEQVRVPTRTLFIANGNNLEFREDMSTRALIAVMDARMERPETRVFKVDLRAEVARRRGDLVSAALTVLRAFAVAGRPGLEGLTPFGRFEEWSATVRGALVWVGEADPCETRKVIAVGDSAREELTQLFEVWEEVFGLGADVKAADLVQRADRMAREGSEALTLALDAICPRVVSARAVGKYLSKVKGRIALGRRIVMVPDDRAGSTYRLEMAGNG